MFATAAALGKRAGCALVSQLAAAAIAVEDTQPVPEKTLTAAQARQPPPAVMAPAQLLTPGLTPVPLAPMSARWAAVRAPSHGAAAAWEEVRDLGRPLRVRHDLSLCSVSWDSDAAAHVVWDATGQAQVDAAFQAVWGEFSRGGARARSNDPDLPEMAGAAALRHLHAGGGTARAAPRLPASCAAASASFPAAC